MPVRIDATELELVLRLTPAGQNILLVGRHGIGKSEIIARSFEEQGMVVVPFFLGQMSDPGDLIGLPHKDEESGGTVFLPPWWWPRSDRAVVLFLDELNRARPELLQAVQDLALNRRLAGKRLPEGSRVVAAVNEGEEYQLTDLDPALVSRFNVYQFAPTVEDWLQWASRQRLDERVIRFIQESPQHLDGLSTDSTQQAWGGSLDRTPDRRSWARVAELIKGEPELGKAHIKVIAGIVGAPAALAFERSLARQTRISADDVLYDFKRRQKRLKALPLSEVILLNEQLVHRLDSAPPPAEKAQPARENLLGYLVLLKREKKQEGIAHLASMLEQQRYQRAMGFAAASVELMAFLVEYIQDIRI